MENDIRLWPLRQAVQGRNETWVFACLCGAEVSRKRRDVLSGRIKSCGCLNDELRIKRNTKHGMAHRGHRNKLYWVWHAMIKRCTNVNDKEYANYGLRGISVCERWMDFANFSTDMGPRPAGLTLERVNVNGNYEAGNCKWATWREQALNRRNSLKNR